MKFLHLQGSKEAFKIQKNYWPKIYFLLQILAAICIGLIDDPANNSRVRIFLSARTIALAYATFGGFIIICGSYILGKVFKDAWVFAWWWWWRRLCSLKFLLFLFIIKKAQNINECPSYIKTNSMFQLKLSFSIPWKITSIINFVGLCLFLASGACILRDWSDIKTRGYWPPNTTRYTQLMLVKCLLHAI